MPRRSAVAAPPPRLPNSAIASAKLIQATRIDETRNYDWQERGWHYWHSIGEFRRGTEWLARGCGRCRLVAAIRNPDGDEPEVVEDGPAADLIENIDLVCGGQANLIEATSIFLSVPGIGYHVGWIDEAGAQHWEPHSNEEIRARGKQFELQQGDSDWLKLPDESIVVQIWHPDRRFAWKPDSPTKSVLKDLREIELITDHIQAGMVSRLAGAGILFIPDEIVFPGSGKAKDDEDPFVVDLMDMMMTPLRDRGNASAVVPLVVKVPGEYVDKIKHITLQVPLDERSLEQRDSALRRLAVSLDIPAEVLTGMGDVNHWGQWQIEETAVKLHIEPMMQAIAYGLTVGYLQPALQALGVDDPDLIVWYDASKLHTRPDLSDDAKALYDRGEVSGEALRRETGFSEADKPEPPELSEWAWKQLLSNPETAAAALSGLGVPVPSRPTPVTEVTESPAPAALPPATPQEPAPPGPPEPTAPEASMKASLKAIAAALAFQEACDGLVCRAMETAGNRLRQVAKIRNAWASGEVHLNLRVGDYHIRPGYLLDGAFARADEVAARYGVEPDALRDELARYCDTIIVDQVPHSHDRLVAHLRSVQWRTNSG